ncbi:hypothetical protein GCM10010121_099700 [Streptomyces brasiliensis]|uniref:Uncharacterized protein n=1 Tax=Streptomyces brasiliensis TaxID=1954 RepID=A0A917UPW0_9ACTN|nr:hypothetical protein GCM10010121_099700 [Streptomyces brasiliensis]
MWAQTLAAQGLDSGGWAIPDWSPRSAIAMMDHRERPAPCDCSSRFRGASPAEVQHLIAAIQAGAVEAAHAETFELVLWAGRFAGKLAASGAVHREAERHPRTGCTRVRRQRREVPCRASRAGTPFRHSTSRASLGTPTSV